MEKYATYNPGFVVIDTPLLGLDQGVDDNDQKSMRTALFNFFIKHQTDFITQDMTKDEADKFAGQLKQMAARAKEINA